MTVEEYQEVKEQAATCEICNDYPAVTAYERHNSRGVVQQRLGWNIHSLVDIENQRIGIDDQSYRDAIKAMEDIDAERKACNAA